MNQFKKYQAKPVEIFAIQWDGTEETYYIIKKVCPTVKPHYVNCLLIPTLEGDMIANKGDYIIQGLIGETYPCKPTVFKQKYEELK